MDLKELCRTCLRTGETMVSIFSQMQVPTLENTELQILEIVKNFTDISLSSNDDLPDHICCECLDKIRWSYIFKLKLRKSEAIMKQVYVDEKKVIKSMSSSNEYEDYAEMRVDLIKIENTENFEKPIDQFEQTSLPEYSTTKAEISIVQEVKQEPEIEINIEGECETTPNKFSLKANLTTKKQLPKDHANIKKVKCTMCSKLLNYSSVLDHMRKIHREKPFHCEVCSKKFSFKPDLCEHMRKDHACGPTIIGKIKCKICLTLMNKKSLRAHMRRMHAGEKLYQCETCLIEFQFMINLRDHMIKEHGPRSSNNDIFKCSICPRLFTRKNGLTHHMTIHKQEKIKCTTCSKVFTAKGTLYQHIRIAHRGESPFQCEICSKKFQLKINLRKHLHKDHGTSKCKICSKVFTYKNALIEHMRIHSGEKPFQCEVCPIKFRTKYYLKIHVRRSHAVETKGNEILVGSQ